MKKHLIKFILIYIFIFTCIWYSLGTFLLAMLVRSVVSFVRIKQFGFFTEIVSVFAIFGAFTILTYFISKWVTIWFVETTEKTPKITVASILVLAIIVCQYYWFLPKSSDFSGSILVSTDSKFTSGPYPDLSRMIQLKKQGYTTIISLLDPWVIPFEPILLREEINNAKIAGIKLINIPMLPWFSSNQNVVTAVQQILAENNQEKYYIHSYYSRDRTLMFIKKEDSLNNFHQINDPTLYPNQAGQFRLSPTDTNIAMQVTPQLIVAPTLSKSSFFYLIGSRNVFLQVPNVQPIRMVIALGPILNDVNVNSSSTNDWVADFLMLYGIDYLKYYLPENTYDAKAIAALAKYIKSRKISGVTLVYGNGLLSKADFEGFVLSYLKNIPVVPPSFFANKNLQNGPVSQIAPNIILGPEPTTEEMIAVLKPHGIDTVLYLGDCKSIEADLSSVVTSAAKINWVCTSKNDNNLIQKLSNNGPWYVYGPDLPAVKDILITHFNSEWKSINFNELAQPG